MVPMNLLKERVLCHCLESKKINEEVSRPCLSSPVVVTRVSFRSVRLSS